MIVRYENSLEDMVAFCRYYCAHSPAYKKAKSTSLTLTPAVFIVGAMFIPPSEDISRQDIIAGAVMFAVILFIVLACTYSWFLDRQVRRLYKEGTNKNILCQHELEIDDNGLVERTEVNETRQSWQGIEKIAETDEHAFIFVSSMAAHVIPKHSVTFGDPDAFIARAKQFWLAANSDSEAGQQT